MRHVWGERISRCSLFLTNDEWQYAFELFGAVAASGRFCGLKSALLSPRLHSYGLERVAVGGAETRCNTGFVAWVNPLRYPCFLNHQ